MTRLLGDRLVIGKVTNENGRSYWLYYWRPSVEDADIFAHLKLQVCRRRKHGGIAVYGPSFPMDSAERLHALQAILYKFANCNEFYLYLCEYIQEYWAQDIVYHFYIDFAFYMGQAWFTEIKSRWGRFIPCPISRKIKVIKST
jgi:hypothetical protein